jgi:hypothetical protein
MELNFDKEMDALLRRAAQQDIYAPTVPAASHLDADELSAFAANALPERARERAMTHLADCTNCRTILSNLVFFENEQEEAATVPLVAKAAAPASLLDRIKNFFALPMLAYGMGALVLAFSGLFVFVMLNNRNADTNVAQLEQSPIEKPAMSKAVANESYAPEPTPASAANTATNNEGNMAAAANTAISGAFSPSQSGSGAPNSNAASIAKDGVSDSQSDREAPKTESKAEAREEEPMVMAGAPAPPVVGAAPAPAPRDEDKAEGQMDDLEMSRNRDNSRAMKPDGAPRAAEKRRAMTQAPSMGAARVPNEGGSGARPVVTKNVRGREFRQDGGLWVDSAYNGGAVTNIARGSKEFKKLDGSIKKTAEELGGTVIIVWKGVAYRIQ